MTPAAVPPARSGGGRRREPPTPVEVVAVSQVSPRLISVLVTGDGLGDYEQAAPTSHLKVFLPRPGQSEPVLPVATPEGLSWPPDDQRPVVRTYTPRRFDPTEQTLELQFFLHEEGPAADWARRATVGDKLAVRGPGGRFRVDEAVDHWLVAGDESALPAVATLLESLPASTFAEVHLEVADRDDEIALESKAPLTLTWHHRGGDRPASDRLYEAVRGTSIPDGAHVWIACEAAAMRRIRRHLLAERGLHAGSLVTRGYWRSGESNHPDHDYGED